MHTVATGEYIHSIAVMLACLSSKSVDIHVRRFIECVHFVAVVLKPTANIIMYTAW